MKRLFALFGLFLSYVAQGQLIINYQAWSPPSQCNIFSPAVLVPTNQTGVSIQHRSSFGQPVYSSGVILNAQRGNNGSTFGGTAFNVDYLFKAGFTYKFTVNAFVSGSANLVLRMALGNGFTSDGLCSGVASVSQTQFDPNADISMSSTNPSSYILIVPSSATNRNVLNISVRNGSNNADYAAAIGIRQITIEETPPPPTFSITPSTLSVPCGSTSAYTFTANNVYNSAGTFTYDWDLTNAANNWVYQGSPAPATFTTTGNSISLTPTTGATSLSNVKVTVRQNTTSYGTHTSTVTVTPPQYNLTISGNQIICNSETYSVQGMPPGAVVAWAIPSNVGPVLQLAQNTPTTNQLTITNQKWYGVTTTLTADISNLGCGLPNRTVPLGIMNDNQTTVRTYNYTQEACSYYGVYHPQLTGQITENSSPVFVAQGCTTYVPLGDLNFRSYAWGTMVPDFWTVGYHSTYGNNTLMFTLPLGSGGVPYAFTITGPGQCIANRTLTFFAKNNNQNRAAITKEGQIIPNPAKADIRILIPSVFQANEVETAKQGSIRLNPIKLTIFDVNSSKPVQQHNFKMPQAEVALNVATLRAGVYSVKIENGLEVRYLKFIKE